MSFIVPTDFKGDKYISQNVFTLEDLQYYIDTVQEKILKELLGEDLYLKLLADCTDNVPATQKYIDLLDGKTYTETNAEGTTVNVQYKGLKEMLRYFTFYYFIKEQPFRATISGVMAGENENGKAISAMQLNRIVVQAYNKGVDLYGKKLSVYETETVSAKIYSAKYNAEIIRGNAYNFLYKYKTTYPTWSFIEKSYIFLI